MKKLVKWFGVVLCLFVFTAMALGSGSPSSSRESVTVEADDKKSDQGSGSEDKEDKEDKEDNSNQESNTDSVAGSDDISYEISDTSFQYYENSIGRTEFYGYVEISNTGNTDIFMDDCTFDIEDDDGHLLQSESMISHCPEVISPGEKGYFYNSVGSTQIDEGVSLDNGIKLVPQIKLSPATGKPHSYPVSDIGITNGNLNDIKVTGRVENDTDKNLSYIYINIIFYDSNGKVLALTGTSLTDIAAGNKGSFDTSTMFGNDNLKLEDIADTKVIAEDTYFQF